MIEKMTHVMLYVRNHEEALDFYVNKLGFVKVTDVNLLPEMRFLTVAPKGQGTEIILHVPNPSVHGEAEANRMAGLIGKTLGLMFKVDDCRKTCDELRAKGVKIVKEPGKAAFGIQATVADLYGNPLWLIEHPK